jgi:hypothetical protein
LIVIAGNLHQIHHDTTGTKNVETDFNDQLPEALPLHAPTPALNSEIHPENFPTPEPHPSTHTHTQHNLMKHK